MTPAAIATLTAALVEGVPRIVALFKKGTALKDIKLEDVISTDALATLESAKDDAENFIDQG